MKTLFSRMLSKKEQSGQRDEYRTAWLQLEDYTAHPITGPFSIGRAKTNSLPLASEKVSRLHALVQVQDGGEHWLVDLGSCNGTFLNGQRVVQPIPLNDGDVIQIGENNIRFLVRNLPEPVADDAALAQAQMTVRQKEEVACWFLVADIENFSTLSGTMDADQLACCVGEWFAACRRLVNESRGTINQYMGDGFLASWNGRHALPLGVLECFEGIKKLQKPPALPFRLALHFGRAVLGGASVPGEASLFGQDANFAFRMEKLAKTLAVRYILSAAAHEGLGCPAEATSLGRHRLPEVESASQFYRL